MLTLHRRHTKACPHAPKGWNYTLCNCPVWCDGMLAGNRIIRSLGTTDWARAAQRAERLARSPEPALRGVSLARAIEEFLASRKRINLKDGSLISYRQTFRHVPEDLAARPLVRIDAEALTRWIDRREIAPGSRRKEWKHLRALFAWVLKERKAWDLESNPAREIVMPRLEELVTQPLTRDEIDRILQACDRLRGFHADDAPRVRRRARALVLTLAYTGLRLSDVVRLRRAALEPSGHLVLRITKNGVPIKLFVHPDARRALEILPAPGGNPTYFFWTGNGGARTAGITLWRTVKRVAALAGIEGVHPHRFRDTFAVELLTAGVDIRTVQKLLGHKSVVTTEKHYAHFVAAHQALLDSAAAKLDFTRPAGRPLLVDPFQHRRRDA